MATRTIDVHFRVPNRPIAVTLVDELKYTLWILDLRKRSTHCLRHEVHIRFTSGVHHLRLVYITSGIRFTSIRHGVHGRAVRSFECCPDFKGVISHTHTHTHIHTHIHTHSYLNNFQCGDVGVPLGVLPNLEHFLLLVHVHRVTVP